MIDEVIDSLALPRRAFVNRRMHKNLIVQNGTQTAAGRRLVNEGIERAEWVAALKPSTVGIKAAGPGVDGVHEIAVVSVECRPNVKLQRLLEIVHRSIPYLVVLVAAVDTQINVSAVSKRASKSTTDQVVLQGAVVEASFGPDLDDDVQTAFFGALSLDRRQHPDLRALYWYWSDVVIALRAHSLAGQFLVPDTHERSVQRWEALRSYERLVSEMATISGRASKETQMARKVELNLDLQRLRNERDALMELI